MTNSPGRIVLWHVDNHVYQYPDHPQHLQIIERLTTCFRLVDLVHQPPKDIKIQLSFGKMPVGLKISFTT